MLAVSDNSILVYCFYNLNTINLPGQARANEGKALKKTTRSLTGVSSVARRHELSARVNRRWREAAVRNKCRFYATGFADRKRTIICQDRLGTNKTEAGWGSQRENVCCRRPPAAPLCPLKTDDAGASAHWTAPSASALQLQVRKTLRRFSRRFLLAGMRTIICQDTLGTNSKNVG